MTFSKKIRTSDARRHNVYIYIILIIYYLYEYTRVDRRTHEVIRGTVIIYTIRSSAVKRPGRYFLIRRSTARGFMSFANGGILDKSTVTSPSVFVAAKLLLSPGVVSTYGYSSERDTRQNSDRPEKCSPHKVKHTIEKFAVRYYAHDAYY